MDEVLYHYAGPFRVWLAHRRPVRAICGGIVRYGNVTKHERNVNCRECIRALNGETK